MKRDHYLDALRGIRHPRNADKFRQERLKRRSSVIVAIERSIIDAHKISKRHAIGKGINAKLQQAALDLVAILHKAKDELIAEQLENMK